MHESAANHCSRASVIRQFSKYLDSIGIPVWILPKNYYPAGQQYVPHIYTPDELRRFFSETDKCCYCSEVPYRHLVMPEFFRLLLSCGLRCSEARLLTVRDVDLHQGILTVRESTTPVQALKYCERLLRRLSQHLTFSLASLPQKRGMEFPHRCLYLSNNVICPSTPSLRNSFLYSFP